MADEIKMNRVNNGTVDFKVSKRSRFKILATNIASENRSAADSTIHKKNIANKIAVLTQDHILKTASVAEKK